MQINVKVKTFLKSALHNGDINKYLKELKQKATLTDL